MFFIIYSFIGWIIEIIALFRTEKRFVNRGFLIGPYCPIYGCGALILIYIMSNYKTPLDLFLMFSIYASILEYSVSYFMEKLFNARWWDYSHMKYNLNGRVCLINAILFGVLGLAMGYFVNPFVMNMLYSIPDTTLMIISSIILIAFIADLIISFKIVSKLKKNFVSKNKDVTEDINNQVSKIISKSRILKAFPSLRNNMDLHIFKK
jgi:uncharacterized membrane protein